jgi:hypothetical protein
MEFESVVPVAATAAHPADNCGPSRIAATLEKVGELGTCMPVPRKRSARAPAARAALITHLQYRGF